MNEFALGWEDYFLPNFFKKHICALYNYILAGFRVDNSSTLQYNVLCEKLPIF